MAIRVNHDTRYPMWFVTFTCYNWIPLFEMTASYHLVYNWLKLISDKYQIETLAFVIMPNHVHLLLQLQNHTTKLNTVVSNGKRFMAYAIVKTLQEMQRNDILMVLADGCSVIEKSKGQKHKVFEPSFDAKPVFSDKFLKQKLDYIHNNPVRGKWDLCENFTDYYHSSATFYELGQAHKDVNIINYSDYR